MSDKNSNWEESGRAGLILGGISAAYILIEWGLGSMSAGSAGVKIVANMLNVLLWIAKFSVCLYLMRFFMLRHSKTNPDEDNSAIFRFGAKVAFLSSIIYSAIYLAYTLFLAPDIFSQAIDMLRDNPMMDAASLEKMEEMIPRMPSISFFVNFIYCWLFGTILSAIFSRNIPSRNPFENDNTDNQ